MNKDLIEERLNDLEDSIRQDMDLLKSYEDELRDERDPRLIEKCRRDIERQHESLTQYQQEYNELQKQATPAEMQNVTDLLQQQDMKLDEIRKLLPPVWNVSHHRNPNFTGREDLLSELRLALTSGEPAAWKQAAFGMGGVGKTQLAVEYIYRHKPDYRVIWWIHSEEPATMAADYAGLAASLDLPEKDSTDQSETVRAVKRWLEHNSGWLLVFDNAQDQRAIRDHIPQGGAGHIIITSRNPDWGNVARLLPVKEFDRADSIEFLLRRTGQDDEKAADALAGELGDLPLALEQAGAYIEMTGTTLNEYQELFRSRREELWEDESPPPDYLDTVATTWSLAMDEVSEESKEAADLLNLCAFLAPDEIYMDVLRVGAGHLPRSLATTVADRLAMNRAIKTLRRYSLIDASSESLSVHRLVQAVVRDRLGEVERKRWVEVVVHLLSAAFPFYSEDVRTWQQCSRLLPHALAAAAHAGAQEVASGETSLILNQTGLYLRGRAEFVEAKDHFKRAVSFAKNAYGRDHPILAIRTNNLGLVLYDLGELQKAKECFERALEINEQIYGGGNPQVATRISNLGKVMRALGDLQGAKEHFERTLKMDEQIYGGDHPMVARDINNLGRVMHDLGDLKGAKEHYERALAIDEDAYGLYHPSVATIVNNLGRVMHDWGELQAAKEHYERALKIDEEVYSREHPMVARDINNLGSVLQDLGNLPAAKEHYERALEMRRRFLGEDHPSTVTVRNNLESLADV
jgi:tetratricopeptide (TPR) repeat protein